MTAVLILRYMLFEFTEALYDARLKHLGVFLGHCHVGMGEHLAHSLDTHALCQRPRRKRVAGNVEYTRQSKQQRTGID